MQGAGLESGKEVVPPGMLETGLVGWREDAVTGMLARTAEDVVGVVRQGEAATGGEGCCTHCCIKLCALGIN